MARIEQNPFEAAFRRMVRDLSGQMKTPGDPALLDSYAVHAPAAPASDPLHVRIFSFPNEALARQAFAAAPSSEGNPKLLWDPRTPMKLRDIWQIWATDPSVDQNKEYDAEVFGQQRALLLQGDWIQCGSIPTGADAQPIFGMRFENPREETVAKAALFVLGIRAQTKLANYSIGELFRMEAAGMDLSGEPRQLIITQTHLQDLRRFG